MEAAWLMASRTSRRSQQNRRRPVLPGRSGGRPDAPRRRPRADLPTLPQTVHGRAAVKPASSPRRADSGCRCRDRAVARRAPHGRPTSHMLGPRLEGPRRDPRAHRAAPSGRRHDRCAQLPWPQPADRSPRRRMCVLTALPHGAAARPPCEWGPPRIYGAARTQSECRRVGPRHTRLHRPTRAVMEALAVARPCPRTLRFRLPIPLPRPRVTRMSRSAPLWLYAPRGGRAEVELRPIAQRLNRPAHRRANDHGSTTS